MKDNRLNIVFFFTDQQRWDTVGVYGQKLPITPNLDKISKKGIVFKNAFTCQPVCGPARACIQTGKYATETGCFRNDIHLPLNERTIAHIFSENGYETAYIGKWHLASSTDKGINYRTKPVPVEFRGGWKDFWLASDVLEFTSHSYDGYMYDINGNKREFPKGRYRADVLTDWAIEYLKNRKSKRPFFLFLSYIEPHHQNDHNRYEGPKGSKERFKDYEIPGDLIDTQGDWRENFPDYLGCCSNLDYNFGRIVSTLEELNLLDNTVVIYTSDHGSHFRTRNSEYKRSCHEASIHIPLIIYGSIFKGGKIIDNLVSLIDLPPTFLKIANIDIPSYMRGRCLQTLLQEGDKNWEDEVFIQISESQIGRAIRTKKLYDLENDPYEKNNLIRKKELKDIKEDLKLRLIKKMIEIGEKEPKIFPPED